MAVVNRAQRPYFVFCGFVSFPAKSVGWVSKLPFLMLLGEGGSAAEQALGAPHTHTLSNAFVGLLILGGLWLGTMTL